MLRQSVLRGGFHRGYSLLRQSRLSYSTSSPTETPHPNFEPKKGWLFIDSVFPIQLGNWDIRYYIAQFNQRNILDELSQILRSANRHGFELISIEPRIKDGGVFVSFKYLPQENVPDRDILSDIQQALRDETNKREGIPSWTGFRNGRLWLVRGKPWREDMRRFASPVIKVAFEGPDIHQEDLYDFLRPYGKIVDIMNPAPAPAGSLRSATVWYNNIRSATIAHNCVHGFTFISEDGTTKTRLETFYEPPIKAHAIRDWMTAHPRIVLPVLFFLLGTLTYTIFDPIRVLSVEGKLLGWFDFSQFAAVKWVRKIALDRLTFQDGRGNVDTSHVDTTDFWKDRQDAEVTLKSYLDEYPSTVAFMHGPAGSGKSRMISLVLKQSNRNVLVIDCAKLNNAKSGTDLVSGLASQTGYWPVFTFLASMNNMIDLASVGLIGQKAGLSSSLDSQLKDVLEVVGTALKRVSSHHQEVEERRRDTARKAERHKQDERIQLEKIKRGVWHDPRLDAVAGNGVMSELGFGDEALDLPDDISLLIIDEGVVDRAATRNLEKAKGDDIAAMPVVVVKNYSAKNPQADQLLTVLAEWSVALVENQVAHVVVLSDNRENGKRLAKSLPSKPLANIGLADADPASALLYIQNKLKDSGIAMDLTPEHKHSLQRLGGRASDLENLLHKVRNGQGVEEAVESIISTSVAELKKAAFGDDSEDAKSLPWSREQVWTVLKQLAKQDELQYYDVLTEFPFKGDETALRAMEHAELIAITTQDARPATIRPGRPVYRYVYERLVNDPIFRAVQDISYNEKAIAAAESSVRSCEEELSKLKELKEVTRSRWDWGKKTREDRIRYLWIKMDDAVKKIEVLDAKNKELKLLLKKGHP